MDIGKVRLFLKHPRVDVNVTAGAEANCDHTPPRRGPLHGRESRRHQSPSGPPRYSGQCPRQRRKKATSLCCHVGQAGSCSATPFAG
jgi:hypothetical protein